MEAVAIAIHEEDIALNKRLGDHGAGLLSGGVLTVCNTGALATGGHGTALGMVRNCVVMNLVKLINYQLIKTFSKIEYIW